MADTNKITYVSLEKLGYYDSKLKAWVTTADDAIKSELQGLITAEETARKAADVTLNTDIETAQAAAEAAQAHSEALAAKVGTVEDGKTVVGMIEDVIASAYDDTEVRGLITALDTNKADKTQVATDIANAVKTEEDARKDAVQGVQDAVDTLSQTHATDKKNLEDAIALKASQVALDEVSSVANAAVKQSDYDTKVAALEAEDTRIAGLVATETERASGVEANLQTQINTIMNNPDTEGVINSINEFTQYISDHGEIAEGFRADIDKNKTDIAEHIATNHDFAAADTVLKETLEAADAAQVERIAALENKFTGEGSVDSKISAAVTETKGYTDTQVNALATGAVADNTEAIETLNGEGEGSVKKAVADAKALIDADIDVVEGKADANAEAIAAINNETTGILAQAKKYADDEDAKIEERVGVLEAASATHALASDLTALAGRVTTAEGEIDTLQSEMDAVEALAAANKAAHEANAAAIALKASQVDLDAVSGRVATLETWHENFQEATTADIDNLFA